MNTVVLKTRHEMVKQEAINSARLMSDDTLDLYQECDVIEEKLIEYIQHELGTFDLLLIKSYKHKFIFCFLGLEVFYQVALQLALLLLTQTKTATVGGLETFSSQDKMFGVPMQPSTVIILSVFLGLKTSILLHVKIFKLKKGFFGFKAKTVTFLWGLVASVRRVLGIVIFFSPSIGLLDLLWHWHAEQLPYQVIGY